MKNNTQINRLAAEYNAIIERDKTAYCRNDYQCKSVSYAIYPKEKPSESRVVMVHNFFERENRADINIYVEEPESMRTKITWQTTVDKNTGKLISKIKPSLEMFIELLKANSENSPVFANDGSASYVQLNPTQEAMAKMEKDHRRNPIQKTVEMLAFCAKQLGEQLTREMVTLVLAMIDNAIEYIDSSEKSSNSSNNFNDSNATYNLFQRIDQIIKKTGDDANNPDIPNFSPN